MERVSQNSNQINSDNNCDKEISKDKNLFLFEKCDYKCDDQINLKLYIIIHKSKLEAQISEKKCPLCYLFQY